MQENTAKPMAWIDPRSGAVVPALERQKWVDAGYAELLACYPLPLYLGPSRQAAFEYGAAIKGASPVNEENSAKNYVIAKQRAL